MTSRLPAPRRVLPLGDGRLTACAPVSDAEARPETGGDRLFDHCARVLAGQVQVERGEHAVS